MLVLTMNLFLLVGCSDTTKNEKKFTDWRDNFTAQTDYEITANVTGHFDDKLSEYTLIYNFTPEKETVSVIKPELIANVSASIEGENTSFSFDGVMLDTGTEIGEKLSPLTALPMYDEFVRDGHLENIWTEKYEETELLVTELQLADASIMCLYQDKETMAPFFASIRINDKIEVKITF